MKGDKIVIQEEFRNAAHEICTLLLTSIRNKKGRYVLSIAGESGSGKSVTGQAIVAELQSHGMKAIVIGQDDYFILPPKANDARRRIDSNWLGPFAEVRLDLLDRNLKECIDGKARIKKPLVDYNENTIGEETIDLTDVKVVIAEGTYTSLLKNVDIRIFITRNWLETLDARRSRNRGNEVDDPFIEGVLAIEHKIIAGHKNLADFLINQNFKVVKQN
jgi:uridine kinase